MKVIALKDFKFSFDRIKINDFEKGQQIEVNKIDRDVMIRNEYAEDYILENKVVRPEEFKLEISKENYTVSELKKMAKEKHIKGYTKMNESQLIEALK